MSSEYDLIKACMEIAREDTGPSGLVTLMSQTVPIIRFFDLGHFDMPIATVQMAGSTLAQGAPKSLLVIIQFDAFVEQGSEGLDVEIIDRITEVMTTANFKAKSLDVGVTWRRRLMLSDLEDGRRRMMHDADMRLTR